MSLIFIKLLKKYFSNLFIFLLNLLPKYLVLNSDYYINNKYLTIKNMKNISLIILNVLSLIITQIIN